MSANLTEVVRPFAISIAAKAKALETLELGRVQQARFRESMSYDLRKCSDALLPDLRPPLVSQAAASVAAELGVNLRREIWQTQLRFDPGRKVFHFGHLAPLAALRDRCSIAGSVDEVLQIIADQLYVAWITKQEDKQLVQQGFASKRLNPREAYKKAGILLIPDT